MHRWGMMMAMAWLAACAPPAADEQLAIPLNPLCSTCDDFLRCDEAAARDHDFLLLHLEQKTFWAQVATIRDYLVQVFHEREEDRRPLVIYTSEMVPDIFKAEAVIDLAQHRIALPGGWIDQRNGAWHHNAGVKGQCRMLPRQEGRTLVRQLRASGH
ncbi:MAG: hypothetical protein KJ054_12935 [Gammaproteobacteria bacterium]|nr:hypothetical protein [Gammaproteobacteria bacterium]